MSCPENKYPYNQYCRNIITGLVIMGVISSCSGSNIIEDNSEPAEVEPYSEGIRISWDYSTLTRIYDEEQSFYPRMISRSNGELISVFESGGAIFLTKSSDEGKSWSAPDVIAPPNGEVRSTVPEIIELRNGHLLVAYNTRPPHDNQNEELRFGIKVISSSDGGYTWTSPVDVYEGGFEWNRGVWEPVMIQPEDEILLFFANEYPYLNSDDQEISLVKSGDNGNSWSAPETISYREGFRDGMPVPVVLENNRVVIAIEDNGMHGSEFKPAIVGFLSIDDLGGSIVDGISDQRWRALKNSDQLQPHEYGGAPYLVQLPGGETVLSFQSTKSRNVGWQQSTMAVAVGDDKGKNFSSISEPFQVDRDKAALWNSLFVKNDTTVTALTSTSAYNNSGVREIYAINGHVMQEAEVPYTPGFADTSYDEQLHSLNRFGRIGAYSPISAEFYFTRDDDYLYIGFEVHHTENERIPFSADIKFESIEVMIAAGKLAKDGVVEGTYKISFDETGDWSTYIGENDQWFERNLAITQIQLNNYSGKQGLKVVGIPLDELKSSNNRNGYWGVNAVLRYMENDTGKIYSEILPGNSKIRPSSWTKLKFK